MLILAIEHLSNHLMTVKMAKVPYLLSKVEYGRGGVVPMHVLFLILFRSGLNWMWILRVLANILFIPFFDTFPFMRLRYI